jgi:hypothetical protein
VGSTDPAATAGPYLNLYRNSASPAVNDSLGRITFTGKDSGGADQEYSYIQSFIVDPVAATEDGALAFYTVGGGTVGLRYAIGSVGQLGIGPTADYGTSGQIFTSGGASAAPSWSSTITNPTVTNYTETVNALGSGTSFSPALTSGTIITLTTGGTTTITLPASAAGKSFIVIVTYGGAHSLVWAGGTTLKWSGGTTPTPTSVLNKIDIFSFFQDGTNTYGVTVGQNY